MQRRKWGKRASFPWWVQKMSEAHEGRHQNGVKLLEIWHWQKKRQKCHLQPKTTPMMMMKKKKRMILSLHL